MNEAIKLGRLSLSSQSSIFSTSITGTARKGAGSVRLVQVTSNSDPPKQPPSTKLGDMDNTFSSSDKSLNVMEESFGAAYATRSDEEGFGGIYGGNDERNTERKIVQDPAHHDSSQGSEVKEKEKARNQTAPKGE